MVRATSRTATAIVRVTRPGRYDVLVFLSGEADVGGGHETDRSKQRPLASWLACPGCVGLHHGDRTTGGADSMIDNSTTDIDTMDTKPASTDTTCSTCATSSTTVRLM